MPTDVMKGPNGVFAILDNKKVIPSNCILHIITRIGEACLVGNDHPFLGEDCSPLKGIKGWRTIPLCGKSSIPGFACFTAV
jgi:hypothetical protein